MIKRYFSFNVTIISVILILLFFFNFSNESFATSSELKKNSNTNPFIFKAKQTCGENFIIDGKIEREGSGSSEENSAVLLDSSSFIILDIGAKSRIEALGIQADYDGCFLIEAGNDTDLFYPLWQIQPISENEKQGLRSRFYNFTKPGFFRFLKISSLKTEKKYHISEFFFFAEKPRNWPPLKKSFFFLNHNNINIFKSGAAFCGVIILIIYFFSAQLGLSEKKNIIIKSTLMIFTIALGFLWWNFSFDLFKNGTHYWEFYHYYFGSAYFEEIGYTGIYECSAAVDFEDGFSRAVLNSRIRNLENNKIEYGLKNPRSILNKYFRSEKRKEQFIKDIRLLRAKMPLERWLEARQDHGYNATPVWTLFGKILSGSSGLYNEKIQLLVFLDTVLIIGIWLMLWKTFGLAGFAPAVIFWGTNFMSGYDWTGGAFMRQLWLFCIVSGVCLLYKKKNIASGFFIMTACLLRIFPIVLIAGYYIKFLIDLTQTRKIEKSVISFSSGLVAAVLLFIPLTFYFCGQNSWFDFIKNSKKHLQTQSSNRIGLKTLFTFNMQDNIENTVNYAAVDITEEWQNRKLSLFEENKKKYYFIAIILIVFLIFGFNCKKDWEIIILSILFIPLVFELSCYYYSVFMMLGLLALSDYRRGVALCVLSAFSAFAPSLWIWSDDWYFYISWLIVIFIIANISFNLKKNVDA